MSRCGCGEPATSHLCLEYRRPRDRFEPAAADPWTIHGYRPVTTCGSPACEAEGCMALLAAHPDADVEVLTEPRLPAGMLASNLGPCPECPIHGDSLVVTDPGAHHPDRPDHMECEEPGCGYEVTA